MNDAASGRSDTDSRTRILASARAEIEQRGILGLRVADVARGAGTSITLIYRHFEDRDGLLAQVLGDIYDESIVYWESVVDSWNGREVGYGDLIAIMPMPDDRISRMRRNLRLQILATAVNNPRLRDRVERSTQRFHAAVHRAVELIRERTGEQNPLDARVYALMLLMFNMMFVSNDMLGDARIDDSDYRDFLHHFFARYDAPA